MSTTPAAAAPEAVCDLYRRIASGFRARVDKLTAAQWSLPTPCPEWTVRDLVAHVVDTHRRVHSRLDASEPEAVGTGEDLLAALSSATAAVQDALDDPDRAHREVDSMAGIQPFASLVGTLLCADTLVHTWDLARATGQDERLDPAGVAGTLAFLTPLDAVIRRPGGFGAKLPVPDDADPQTRLLTFCGRAV